MDDNNFLNKLRSLKVSTSKFKKINELEKEKEYEITSAKKISTKFGESILVELDEEILVYLPKRYNALDKKEIKQLLDLSLVFHGEEEIGNGMKNKFNIDFV